MREDTVNYYLPFHADALQQLPRLPNGVTKQSDCAIMMCCSVCSAAFFVLQCCKDFMCIWTLKTHAHPISTSLLCVDISYVSMYNSWPNVHLPFVSKWVAVESQLAPAPRHWSPHQNVFSLLSIPACSLHTCASLAIRVKDVIVVCLCVYVSVYLYICVCFASLCVYKLINFS